MLVILGLLVGGIMTGQNLIRAAELRSITTERDKYIAAVYTFRDKYFALPGDMSNAEAFWGTAANCPGNDTQGTTDGTTCDGDGNGIIHTDNPDSREYYRAWQHLANAGLVEGNYNGVSGPGSLSAHSVIGTNVPRSKLGNAGWTLRWYDHYNGDSETYDTDAIGGYRHILDFGAQRTTNVTRAEIISPEEVWNIDTKVDDGLPSSGNVIIRHLDQCTYSTSKTDIGKDYKLDATGNICAIIFRNVI